jgi:hypothetical protein
LIYTALAGLVAVILGDADLPKQAIAYGVAWEAFLKGLASAGSVATAS